MYPTCVSSKLCEFIPWFVIVFIVWSGGFCLVFTDKSPTLRGPTCQGVLGLVYFGAISVEAGWIVHLLVRRH